MKIISLGFGTITWFLSFVTHDSWSLDICHIISFGAIDFEKLAPQKNLRSTFEPYDWPSSWDLAFLGPNAINFTWVTMLVIRASNYLNLTSMVLGWHWAGLVANPLLATPFAFWPLPKPWPLLALVFYDWPCRNSGWNVSNDWHHAHMHDNGNMDV